MAGVEHGTVFSKLPIEIRLIIYSLVLKKDEPIVISGPGNVNINPDMDGKLVCFTKEDCRRSPGVLKKEVMKALTIPPTPDEEQDKPPRHTALLSVCKEINAETVPMLFAENMLLFDAYAADPYTWFGRLGNGVRHLRRLTVWLSNPMMIDLDWPWGRLYLSMQYHCTSVDRITLLFQSTAYNLDAETRDKLKRSRGNLLNVLGWVEGDSPWSVDVGFFPTLVHAFNALSDQYRY
ncbi:hypothetical protein GGR54DRAFT_582380 [Hypoxylon sp. NC1633]|nr:hypothetical protein GGR54DRAFT_582380 [Hypoxylon sp. NC1633]